MVNQTHRIPLFAALTALVVYVCTLGGGVTANSLPLTATVAGWDETPMVGQPLLWLLTQPVHLLPAAWVSICLKLFSASMAALIWGLLARTIQLLPWDLSWENASPLARALPMVMACAVCGLEFGFWQEATSASSELLDLLLLATALWLLLEYNLRREPRWLNAAVFVWGLGMAENWLMLLALPLFVAGLIWLRGLMFFRWKFVLRMAGLGLAGFSVYAILPLVNGLAPDSPWTMHQAWLASLRQTKFAFLLLYQFWRGHRLLTLAVGICFLVPSLPLLVRLRDQGTQNQSKVERFQLWIYRSLRAGLLLACGWLAFDPAAGPQQVVQREFGVRSPMLTFVYVNALGTGFLAGNLLLLSQAALQRRRRSRTGSSGRTIGVSVAATGLALLVIGLTMRNAPAIVRLNFHPLEKFGESAVNSLPTGGGVVLSDFRQKLEIFQAALAHHPAAADWLAVDTRALPSVKYRARLERRQPAGWLTDANRHELNQMETYHLLQQVALTNRLFYLHPSYGYFFEAFYLEPTGTIYEMKLRGENPLTIPPLSSATTEANEKFWTGLWDQALAKLVPPSSRRPGWVAKKLAPLGVTPVPRYQDRLLAEWYSIPLSSWGVTLQKQGPSHLQAAQLRLQQALQLNTNNLSAQISMACNTNLQAGNKMGLEGAIRVAQQLGNPSRVNLILDSGGPFDEPTLGYLLGGVFFQAGHLIQAAEQFERVRALAPDAPASELALAEIYNRLQMTDRARPLINHLRETVTKLPPNSALDLNLALLESYSWLLQTNVPNARNALQSVVEHHPDDAQIRNRVLGAYLAFGDFTNALRLVEAQLATMPEDVPALNTKAIILTQSGRADEALPILNHVLTLTNLPAARINRAFAQLARQDLASAESDFHALEKDSETLGMADFGLAAVAERRQDTNQMVRHLRLCLTNTPAGTPLWRQATARLQTLEPATVTR